jgi:very-short-patch-repair endonuclease
VRRRNSEGATIQTQYPKRKLLARILRRVPTDAEAKLWSRLRDRRLAGFKFRRQLPRGPYVLDLYCLEQKLVVEVDGGQHSEAAAQDAARTKYLERQGFIVVRFWNNDVLSQTELEKRKGTMASPRPSP